MLTIELLQKDMMQSMKDGDVVRKSALSNAISAIKKTAIDRNCRSNITEELIVEVIRKEIKIIHEQIATCPVDRQELVKEFRSKKEILEEYIPALVTDENEISLMITNLLKDITVVDKGQVMRFVMPVLKGKVDMKIANKVISDIFKPRGDK